MHVWEVCPHTWTRELMCTSSGYECWCVRASVHLIAHSGQRAHACIYHGWVPMGTAARLQDAREMAWVKHLPV